MKKSSNLKRCALTTFLTLATIGNSSAETNTQFDESDFLLDIPVISSATRLPQALHSSPVAVSYIDRDMIQSSGATEIAQLLRLVPGMLSYYHSGNHLGVSNGGPTLEYSGDLEITLDGRSVYQPIYSAVYWTTLGVHIDDIEYIEVIRGTNGAAYGSNAFLGAVNIVTNRLAQTRGLSLRSSVGSIGTRDAHIEYKGASGAAIFSTGVYYRHNNGFHSVGNQRPIERVNDGAETLHWRGDVRFSPGVENVVTIHAGIGENRIGVPAAGFEAANVGFRHRKISDQFQMLRWDRTLLDGNQMQLQLYHNRTELDELVEYGLLSEALGLTPELVPLLFDGQQDQEIVAGLDDALSERYDLELNHSFYFGTRNRAVWGVAARFDRMRSQYLFNNSHVNSELSSRAFTNAEFTLSDATKLNLGFSVEHAELVGTLFSPRIALNWSASRSHHFRLTASRGNRKPSVLEALQDSGVRFADGTEIDADIDPDPNISESRIDEFDVGYIGQYLDDTVQIDARVVRSEASDVIDDRSTGSSGAPAFRSNLIDWKKTSFESQLKLRLTNDTFASLQYAYTDLDGSHTGRPRLRWTPARHNASLLLRTLWHGFELSSTVSHLSDTRWEDGSDGEELPSFTRTDMRIARDLATSRGKLKAALIGQNLFGTYAEYRRINQFQRRFFIQLSYEFE